MQTIIHFIGGDKVEVHGQVDQIQQKLTGDQWVPLPVDEDDSERVSVRPAAVTYLSAKHSSTVSFSS